MIQSRAACSESKPPLTYFGSPARAIEQNQQWIERAGHWSPRPALSRVALWRSRSGLCRGPRGEMVTSLNALEQRCELGGVAPEQGYRLLVVRVRLGAQVRYSARDVYDKGTEFLVRAEHLLAQGGQATWHVRFRWNSQSIAFLENPDRILTIRCDRFAAMAGFGERPFDRDLQCVLDLAAVRLGLDKKTGQLARPGGRDPGASGSVSPAAVLQKV